MYSDTPWRFADRELVNERDQYRFRQNAGAADDAAARDEWDSGPSGSKLAAMRLDSQLSVPDVPTARPKAQPEAQKKGGGGLFGHLKSAVEGAGSFVSEFNPATQAFNIGKDIYQGDNPLAGHISRNAALLGQATSGESFLERLGVDSSGLPTPARQFVDVAAAPATYASLGLGGPAATGGKAAAKALALRYARTLVAGTGAELAQKGAEEQLPAGTPDWARTGIGLGAAVGTGAFLFDPESTVRAVGKAAPGFGGSVVENVGDEAAKQAAMDFVKSEKANIAGRNLELEQQRGAQLGGYREALGATGDLPAGEAHQAAKATMAGKFGFTPGDVALDPAHIPFLEERARAAIQGEEVPTHVGMRVLDDLADLKKNPRSLTQREIDDWTTVFGKNQVDALVAGDGPAFHAGKEYPTLGLPDEQFALQETTPPRRTVGGSDRLAGEAAPAADVPAEGWSTGIEHPGVTGGNDLELRSPTLADLQTGAVAADIQAPASAIRAGTHTTWDKVADVVNLPMGIITGPDISATGRQGLAIGAGNLKQVPQAFVNQIKSFRSKANYDAAMEAIRQHKFYGLLKESGLFLGSESDELPTRKITLASGQVIDAPARAAGNAREEVLASRLVDKIPGLKGSARAYVAYLDTLRSSVFYKEVENMYADASRGGEPVTEKAVRELAEVLNHGSGRGTGSLLDKTGALKISPFFSIRNAVSKPQLLADMFTKEGVARKQAIQQVMGMGSVIGGFNALAYLSGVGGVQVNPFAGDFGKVKLGDHKVDITGGLAGLTRTAAQATDALGQQVTGKSIGQELGFDTRDDSAASVLGKFTEGKLSPALGVGLDVARDSDYTDHPLDWTKITGDGSIGAELSHLGIPLLYGDLKSASDAEFGAGKDNNGARFFAVGLLSLLGAGTRSGLSPQEQVTKAEGEAAQRIYGQGYDALPGEQKSLVNEDAAVAPLVDAAQQDSASRTSDRGRSATASKKYADQVDALSKELEGGEIDGNQFRDQLHTLQSELRGARDVLGSSGPKDALVDGWFKLSDQAKSPSGRIDYDKLDKLQADYENANPTVLEAVDRVTGVHDNATLREYRAAKRLQNQYQDIPSYIGLDAQQSQKAGKVLNQARAMVSYGMAPNLQVALMMASGDDPEAFGLAYMANKLGANPERDQFRKNPDNALLAKYFSAA